MEMTIIKEVVILGFLKYKTGGTVQHAEGLDGEALRSVRRQRR